MLILFLSNTRTGIIVKTVCGGNYVKVTEMETPWLCCPNKDRFWMMHTKNEIHVLHVFCFFFV